MMADPSDPKLPLPVERGGTPAVTLEVPRLVAELGPGARLGFDEFCAELHGSDRTARAYFHAVRRFLGHVESQGLGLREVSPAFLSTYITTLRTVTSRRVYVCTVPRCAGEVVPVCARDTAGVPVVA
jgi:hypothetical protein